MSTSLGSVYAKIEIPKLDGSMTSDYKDTEVFLNRFYGGVKRGKSLQITFLNEKGDHSDIQLDSANIKVLKTILNAEFD